MTIFDNICIRKPYEKVSERDFTQEELDNIIYAYVKLAKFGYEIIAVLKNGKEAELPISSNSAIDWKNFVGKEVDCRNFKIITLHYTYDDSNTYVYRIEEKTINTI